MHRKANAESEVSEYFSAVLDTPSATEEASATIDNSTGGKMHKSRRKLARHPDSLLDHPKEYPTRPAKSRTKRTKADNELDNELTSSKLAEYMSKMPTTDQLLPDESVILTPSGYPARCFECMHYVTVDHFVSLKKCAHCKFATHCTRAAINHHKWRHV